jgi:stage V sporulation protein B
MDLVYDAPTVAGYLKIMAPFSLFLYFQGPLQAALQALNLAKSAMMNSLIGAIVKTATIFILASRPELGIMGAALGVVLGFILVTILHFATLVKAISFTINLREIVKVIMAMIASGVIGYTLWGVLTSYYSLLWQTVLSIIATSVTYFILVFALKIVHRSEIRKFPYIGKFF